MKINRPIKQIEKNKRRDKLTVLLWIIFIFTHKKWEPLNPCLFCNYFFKNVFLNILMDYLIEEVSISCNHILVYFITTMKAITINQQASAHISFETD
ncbi:hypothetical protein BpHYR1_016437 [Brachionus plicatilis]|uniref:Uncharacterized protein n=1 Tax=Brachionus plicatilis TaxID=10195 RepID=A0A3M7QZ35_BRAPC|nr:hypothetical protein BpHYR1_016437 [Brachionus plicatilis]